MKKNLILIAIFFTSIPLMGQDENRLNEMIIESIYLYLDYKIDLRSKVCKDCEPYIIPHICRDGLPSNFPCDSLPNFTFFSLNNFESYPMSFKKKLNKGIGVWFIGIELMNNQIVITIPSKFVKRTKKKHLEIIVGEWGVFTYEYSCELEQWYLESAKYEGV